MRWVRVTQRKSWEETCWKRGCFLLMIHNGLLYTVNEWHWTSIERMHSSRMRRCRTIIKIYFIEWNEQNNRIFLNYVLNFRFVWADVQTNNEKKNEWEKMLWQFISLLCIQFLCLLNVRRRRMKMHSVILCDQFLKIEFTCQKFNEWPFFTFFSLPLIELPLEWIKEKSLFVSWSLGCNFISSSIDQKKRI